MRLRIQKLSDTAFSMLGWNGTHACAVSPLLCKRRQAAERLRDVKELLAGFFHLLCRGRISCGPGGRRKTAPLQQEDWAPSREGPWKEGTGEIERFASLDSTQGADAASLYLTSPYKGEGYGRHGICQPSIEQ